MRSYRSVSFVGPDWLELPTPPLDLSWVSEKWWPLVTGMRTRKQTPQRVARRHFEVCVFSQVMSGLLSGDLCIVGSEQFIDISMPSSYTHGRKDGITYGQC
jgi:hypothetical protein